MTDDYSTLLVDTQSGDMQHMWHAIGHVKTSSDVKEA